MSPTHPNGLSAAQVESFITDGFVRLDDAFSRADAERCTDALWTRTGLSPDRPEDWTAPVIRVGFQSAPPFVAVANTARLHRAYDQLAGAGRWIRPAGLGTIPIRFPSDSAPGDDGWHIDVSFGTDHPDFMQWRANVTSRDRALLMLFLLSDVGAEDAPTRIRKGSHHQIARDLLPHGEAGATLAQLSADGYRSTENCETVLATGPAGTVYLCHPFLVHAAQAHRGRNPRFMAQPALLPTGPFDPALPPSPVQIAIRRACGLA
ncbi:phytanoyl-CoA dioxygenase [Oceanicola sp. 22II-s10i]|uniref:phytanoyl-CoA dioxygenase family protein n=1 Tax=Oceanicola sp. 22II-s10i TaxID=1317116 RepID=UPI000B525BE4|nr:phytanoyl-CoA dioxygenase family protein [Oceanicola sp. 22II-s10i]OWU85203.1 phytanoyl-CoA dioxygenase [Oceanicola sp. 22II-s10i]